MFFSFFVGVGKIDVEMDGFFLKKFKKKILKKETMERDSLSEDTWTGSRVRSFRNGKPSKKNEKKHRYDDGVELVLYVVFERLSV